ncbi:two-component sensor histidine kinase [Planobispora rosea]|uniref:histidine kinase n=1 Tax=Planobispora rosea TaxID=35762 RepID=A0A8J3WF46_PLARO|nr:histidine kinase [Planobispora rosea]GGS90295.1 two-component sensor histidine kinase [Planobispora rosea]GIH86958.1 two-component sensor histidine kinase [Planobispora rosea]
MGENNRLVYWIQRLSEIALLCWLGLLLLFDIAIAATGPYGLQFLSPICGAYGIYAVWRRQRSRVRPFVILLVLSFTATLVMGIVKEGGIPGLAETGSLLILTIGGLRWIEPIRNAVVFALASMMVLEVSAGRTGQDDASLAGGFLLFVGWSVAAGVGAYLRFQLERRKEAVHSVRRAERLELARELHDLVAHHITGIVVQAQAARVVAEQKPDAVLPALDAIAGAGADALTSMRRLVSVLRAEDEAARSPGTRLTDMRALVERFSAGGPKVAFEIGQGIADDTLAPEVMTTLHRVLQESLTNVRRHAPGTAWVEADLRLAGPCVRLGVRNYGSAADSRISGLGGGFGLVGMAERVEALGGRLYAGFTPQGAWEVLAELPAHGDADASRLGG